MGRNIFFLFAGASQNSLIEKNASAKARMPAKKVVVYFMRFLFLSADKIQPSIFKWKIQNTITFNNYMSQYNIGASNFSG